jgi:hypothetical protein
MVAAKDKRNPEIEYLADEDPISGAPVIVAVPKTVRAAREAIPYNVLNDLGELFERKNLREAWRILRKNDPFDYQLEAADAIIYSCLNHLGWFFVVMITRQAGKNEISAFVEHYLMVYGWYYGEKVSGVKFAPVHKPQVQASKDRLEGAKTADSGGLAGCILTKDRWRQSDGYKYHIGPPRDTNKWAFLSINPAANIASQTALTLLEGDEAQDIDQEKWERDAQPMGSFNNATTVLYGVAWSKDSFIYHGMQQALEMEKRVEKELGYRPRLVFKFDAYRVIRSGNENYRKAFENQLARLGPNHIAIQTQYLLKFIDATGAFFAPEAVFRMYSNTYRMHVGPEKGKSYIFSVDVAGQEEELTELGDFDNMDAVGTSKRDSTVLKIGELTPEGRVIPVCIYQWTGKAHSAQRETILRILKYWGVMAGVVDSTGIGEPLAFYLIEKLPHIDIEAYKFRALGDENKSKLGYLAYYYSAADLVKIPQRPENNSQQAELWDELKYQVEKLIREAKKRQTINWYVPANAQPRFKGHVPHDDFVTALFLLIRAAYNTRDPNRRKASAGNREKI